MFYKMRTTCNFCPCARCRLLIGRQLSPHWSQENLHFIRLRGTNYGLYVLKLDRRSRIFLPFAMSCAALFCCRLAILASSLGWLVDQVMLSGLQFSKGLWVFRFRQSSESIRCLGKSRGKGVHSPNFTRLRCLKSVPFK